MTRDEVDNLKRGARVIFKFGPHPVEGAVDTIYEEKDQTIIEVEYLSDGAAKTVKRNRKLVEIKMNTNERMERLRACEENNAYTVYCDADESRASDEPDTEHDMPRVRWSHLHARVDERALRLCAELPPIRDY